MKKKLYKAKKNWVIGLVAGAILLFGGNAVVNADTTQSITTTEVQQVAKSNGNVNEQSNSNVNRMQVTEQQTQWSEEKDQQLQNYMTSYGQQNGMEFQKYDGSTPMKIDGDYPDFDITKVHADQGATVGLSKDGSNKYDYNVVAIYNHYAGNRRSQFHDTYWFAFHNNQPIVLEDSTTNGGTIWLNNAKEVSYWNEGYAKNVNNFQFAFNQLNKNEPVYDFNDHGNYAWLDQQALDNNGQLYVTGWHATNSAVGKNYRYIIVLDGQTHREIARKNITKSTVQRSDVAKVHNVYQANHSGFNTNFDLTNVLATTSSIQIVDRYTNDPAGNGQSADYWFKPIKIDHNNYANLDQVTVNDNKLRLTGWHATNEAASKKYHYVILLDKTNNRELGRQEVKEAVSRPDVAKVYPTVYNSGKSGFDVQMSLNNVDLTHQLQVVDRYTDDSAGNGHAIDYWFETFGGNYTNQGCLDNFNLASGSSLKVSGWHANDVSALEQNHFIILFDNTDNKQVASTSTKTVSRPDVAKVYSKVKTAGNAGFTTDIDLKNAHLLPGHSYSVVSRYSTSALGNGNDGAHTDYWFSPVQLNKKASYIDNAQMTAEGLRLNGWMIDDGSINRPHAYLIVMNNGREVVRQKVKLVSRPDVAKVYSNVYNSQNSGFNTLIKFDPAKINGKMQVIMRFTDDSAGNGNYCDQYSQSYDSNAGFFDRIDVSNNKIYVSGWHATNQNAAMPYQYLIALDQNGQELYRWQIPDSKRMRNDVASVYPTIYNSGRSGYQLSFSIPNQVQHHTIRFIHRYSNDPAGNGNYVDVYSNPVSVNNLMRTPIDFRQPSEYAPYPNINQLKNFWIHVKIGQNRVYMMDGNDVVYRMYCTAGKYVNGVSLTPTGTYYVQKERGDLFDYGAHWTSWKDHGVYLFHSVVFDGPWRAGHYDLNQAKLLGVSAGSHGCIRLPIPDAYWIQHNVPAGTKVVIEN